MKQRSMKNVTEGSDERAGKPGKADSSDHMHKMENEERDALNNRENRPDHNGTPEENAEADCTKAKDKEETRDNKPEAPGEAEKGIRDKKPETAGGEEKGMRDKKPETAGGEEKGIRDKKSETADGEEKRTGDKKPEAPGEAEKEAEDKKSEGKNESEVETRERPVKRKILIPVGILFVLLAVCGCIYSVIAFSYKEKFLPGTWINGIDCTEMEKEQAAGLLQEQLQAYHLEVMGRTPADGTPGTLLGQVTAEDIHLTYAENSEEILGAFLEQQNVFTWLYRELTHDTFAYDLFQGVSYDKESLERIVNGWDACQPGSMISPKSAYISEYSSKRNGYEIIPEVEGTCFDVNQLLELMNTAILSKEDMIDLEAEGCYEEPEIRQDDPSLTEPVETANKWLGAVITYDWNGAEVTVDAGLLKDWVRMEKTGPVLDETAVASFVEEHAEENDTYGKRRSFLTSLGVELSLPSGYYGWLTDQEAETKELIRLIHEGKKVSREPVYASTARQKGMSDIGNSYVEADLTHQHLYLYEGGSVIFETDFVSGSMSSTPDCVTPEGVFGLSYKTTNAVLRGANYETPVNYWMPFYGNYGMHDATWRSEFGGGIFVENGSHGCLNLPLDAAAAIYGHVSTGFPVICYYYQVDPLADQYAEENWDDSWDDNDDDDGE